MLTPEQVDVFRRDGYLVVRGLFSQAEVMTYREHFMALREQGVYPGDFAGVDITSNDPLKRYPRMIHMHRWDDLSLHWLLDPRLCETLTGLSGRQPYATQTMLYFKPAGARGQALHQDQYYLNAEPGTCMAAWLALDDCDEENGCLEVVPGTGDLPLLCTIKADTTRSFTDVTVPLAPGMRPMPVIMQPGDVLFFNGSLIHGSEPNVSQGRFRRALIGHYIAGDAEKVAEFYHPVLRMDGTVAALGVSRRGERCGVWTETDGRPTVMMTTQQPQAGPLHE